ncbi:MAG: hypothetical protein MGG11_02190 [Trichodesmium sp. MAG_R03]|nr:hypothetical protein [Trichodesmium sp. MAG_R03]
MGWVFPTIIKLFTPPFKARGHWSRGRFFHRRAIASEIDLAIELGEKLDTLNRYRFMN